ncbi:MAG: Calx-beta domain-containing protein [Aggregatilineales bacterium]
MKLKALFILLCCILLLSIPSEKTFAAPRFSVLPDFFGFDSSSNVASWPAGAEATCDAVTVYVSYPQNENPLGIPDPIYDYVDWSLINVLDKDGNVIPSDTGLIHSFPAGTTAGEQHSATFNFTNPLQAGQSFYLRLGYSIVGGNVGGGSDTFDMGAVGLHPYWQFRAGDDGSSNSFFCDPAIEADPPTVSLLGDVVQLEGNSGAVVYNATLFLDKPINEPVIVDIGSRDAADLPAYSATFPSFNGYGTRGIQFGSGVCVDSGDPSCIVPEYSTVTIPAGQTSITVPVNLFGDTSYTWTYPVRDNYDLYIVRAGNAEIGNQMQINLSQRNDDPCVAGPDPDCNRIESNPGGQFPVSADPVTFTVSNIVVDEDDGNAVFTVNLSVANPLPSLTISYATTSGNRNSTENVDYVATSGNLIFTSGQTTQQVSVPLILNPEAEDIETFGMTFAKVGTNDSESATVGAMILDVYDACPDGTPGNDTIVCEQNPPVGTNTDGNVDGGLGSDSITINNGVTLSTVFGENINDNNGSNDTIVNYGTANEIIGDGITINNSVDTFAGGNDIITNETGAVVNLIRGDGVNTFAFGESVNGVGGNDIIVNNGLIELIDPDYTGHIQGDSVYGIGGNDSITNTGIVEGDIRGDQSRQPGLDTIINSGTVLGNIYGDYISVSDVLGQITGEGAADTITNSGTVGGTIFAEGGDDTVILQDGANGGADNILPLDGGSGTDTLRFEFTGLTDQQSEQILAQNPANGSVVVGGKTFNFTNFEVIEVPGYVPSNLVQFAPNGTITNGYGNPSYSWSDTDVANFELYVARVDNTQIINPTVASSGICNGATCSIDLTTLAEANRLTDGAHLWYVREAGSTWVGPMNFTLDAIAPALVTLGTTTGLDNLKPTFNWTLSGTATNATSFNVYVAPSANVGVPTVNQAVSRAATCGGVNGTTCSLISPVGLTGGVQYQVYIQTKGPGGLSTGGTGGYAGPDTFTVNPVFPTPISPNGSVNLPTGNPTYTWTDIAGASHYYLYVANIANQQIINEVVSDVGYCNGTQCQIDATTLRESYRLPNGAYTFYVRGWKDGQATPWSGGMSFTVNSTLPGAVTKVFPLEGESTAYNTTFQWNEVANVSGYNLYLVNPNGVASGVLRGEVGDEVICSTGTCGWNTTLASIPGTWTWYVQAFNSAGAGAWSAPTTFTAPTAIPDVIAKVAPTANQALTDSTATFSWTADSDATQYQLYMTGPNGWISDVTYEVGADVTCATNCSVEVVLPYVGDYLWYLRGYSAAGWGKWSAGEAADGYGAQAFSVTDTLPSVVAKIAPTNAQNLDDLTVTFSWTPDAEATYYQSYVLGPNGFVSDRTLMVGTEVTCASTCDSTLTLPVNGAYSWYLRGYSAAGWGAWSAGEAADNYGVVNFTVGQPLPGVIAKTGPTASEVVPVANMVFDWTHDANATKYEVSIVGPNGYASYAPYVVGSGVTCASSCALNLTLPANGAYTWYLRGGNAAGWGPWSAGEARDGYGGVAFSVAQPLPAVIAKISPAASAVVTTLSGTFTWTPDANATKYEVYVAGPNGFVSNAPYVVGAGVTCASDCVLDFTFPANGAYMWYVRGGNDAGWGLWSVGEALDGYGGVAFSVAQPLPGAATLLTPANDAVIYQTNRPTFTWNSVNTATYYRLYVVNGMGLPAYDQWHIAASVCSSTCSFQLPNPLAFGGYTWQIQTYNITGVGALSASRSFLSLSFNLQPLMVQVENGAITRSGAWTQQASESAVGQAYLQSSTSGADTLTMTFTGTQVDVVYVSGVEYGTFVVEIDGEPMRGVNANATQTAFGQIASFTDLSDGAHTLRIIPLGGAPVAIDALIVNGQVLTTQPVEEAPVVIPAQPTDEAPISTPQPEVTDEVVIVPVQPEITPDVEVTDEP